MSSDGQTPDAGETSRLRARLAELERENHALRREVVFARAMIEETPLVIYAKDTAQRFVLSNARHRALVARPPGEIYGHTDRELFPDAADDIDRVSETVLATGRAQASEFVLPIEGEERTFLETIFALRDAAGVVFGLGGISTDVSERVRAQRELEAKSRELAVANAALYGSLRLVTEQNAQHRMMVEISTALARAGSRAALFATLVGRLCPSLGVDRVVLCKRRDGAADCGVRLLDERPAAALGPRTAGPGLDPDAEVDELSDHELNGTAVAEVLRFATPRSTREHARSHFRDWQSMSERFGLDQFVTVPLFSEVGVFGALCVGLRGETPPTFEQIGSIVQFGSMLSAHLGVDEARENVKALNAQLEGRVLERTHALLQSEARFGRLFEEAPQALLIVDGAHRVVQSNRAARSLFAYEESQLVGLPVAALVPEPLRASHEVLMRRMDSSRASGVMASGRAVGAVRRGGVAFDAEIGLVHIDLNGEPHVLAGVTDVSARVAAQEAVTRSLSEKETLLKEIHHRVKNNLQVISSLLALQADHMETAEPAKRLLEESVHRVRAMALIHQQLYGVESLDRIEFGEYARTLAETLRGAFDSGARLSVVATTTVYVTVEIGVPLGLILNELLTNAFKYGSPTGEPSVGRTGPDCDILVEVGVVGDTVKIAVVDSGPGLPLEINPGRASSLGLQLVRSLCRQLRSKLTVDSDRGARFELSMPLPPRD